MPLALLEEKEPMSRKLCFCVVGLLLLSASSRGAEPSKPAVIRFQRSQGVLFLHGADVAATLDLELKIVQPQQLITFCQSGDEGLCIPVRLTSENHKQPGRT